MAKDIYHYTVRAALEKDGWTITDDPLRLPLVAVPFTSIWVQKSSLLLKKKVAK